jgi:hypothetical protein
MFFLPDFFSPYMQGLDFAEKLQSQRSDNQTKLLQNDFDTQTFQNRLGINNQNYFNYMDNSATARQQNSNNRQALTQQYDIMTATSPAVTNTAINSADKAAMESASQRANAPKNLLNQQKLLDSSVRNNQQTLDQSFSRGLTAPGQDLIAVRQAFTSALRNAFLNNDFSGALSVLESYSGNYPDLLSQQDLQTYYQEIKTREFNNIPLFASPTAPAVTPLKIPQPLAGNTGPNSYNKAPSNPFDMSMPFSFSTPKGGNPAVKGRQDIPKVPTQFKR